MDYILYKKDIPILRYEEGEKGYIISIKEFYNTQHMPPHLFTDGKPLTEYEYAIAQKLEDFLENRLIPFYRKYLKDLLQELDLHSSDELAKRSFYLSLSDQYWVCPYNEKDKLKWKNINFFSNEYDSAIGLRLVDGAKSLNKHSNSTSPDNATPGELPKRWLKIDGINYLEKAGTGSEQQEPLNEVLSSEICRRLGFSYVPYTFKERNNQYFCLCPDMVDENSELVPMASVYQDIKLNDGKYDFEKLVERCKLLKIPHAEDDLLKIILLDFIIANEDRHSYNISFIRDTNTLEWKGISPVYDSGKSMFLNMQPFEMDMTNSRILPSKSFEEFQYAQFEKVPVEKIIGLVDFSKLNDIGAWYKNFLSDKNRLTQEKRDKLVSKLEERIAEAQKLMYEKFSSKADIRKSFEPIKHLGSEPINLIYNSLCKNPSQTKEELSLSTGCSRATVTRALQKLTAQNKIKRLGSNKSGSWEFL